jgi:LysM repeat protein
MVRSATALFAVLILSGFAALQQVATHTVVAGDTLWDLAQRYYQSPWEWRRIWEANRAQVTDPNLILPGWVLTIPGREAEVTDVSVQTPAAQAPSAHGERTVFYQDTSAARHVILSTQGTYVAVPRDMVYAAPWLVPWGEEPAPVGKLDSFAEGAQRSETPRGWDRVHLVFDGEVPAVGTQLRTFRITKSIENVGRVATPTGMVTLSEVSGRQAVAIVTKEYARIGLGDLLTPLPAYGIRAGQFAEEVSGGSEAMVMGFAGTAVLQDVGAVAFLDQGSDQGVGVGDEFEYVNRPAGQDVVEGRLQVVGVTPSTASARVVGISDAVFQPGLVVRLARKMR